MNNWQEHTTDSVLTTLPTLEDLGIYPVAMEKRITWELKPLQTEAYYMEKLGEFEKPEPPKPVSIGN